MYSHVSRVLSAQVSEIADLQNIILKFFIDIPDGSREQSMS